LGWNGWPLERVIILAMGLLFLVIAVQVTLFHYRQNFRHWSMWIPVLATPIFGVGLVLYTFYNTNWLLYLMTILLSVGIIAGVFGTFMHIRGVGKRVEGYKLRNFLIGPPLTLPAFISAVSIIGLIALYWG
jgi:cytochrome c oxidase assembly factor CtaG